MLHIPRAIEALIEWDPRPGASWNMVSRKGLDDGQSSAVPCKISTLTYLIQSGCLSSIRKRGVFSKVITAKAVVRGEGRHGESVGMRQSQTSTRTFDFICEQQWRPPSCTRGKTTPCAWVLAVLAAGGCEVALPGQDAVNWWCKRGQAWVERDECVRN